MIVGWRLPVKAVSPVEHRPASWTGCVGTLPIPLSTRQAGIAEDDDAAFVPELERLFSQLEKICERAGTEPLSRY
ncbi:hypothetical protein FFK22_025165 [Mycobacterium sp. KBS0706]|nr:hypothetical protein FFK22_025165 [Mycobacterium sp. KBS0706]